MKRVYDFHSEISSAWKFAWRHPAYRVQSIVTLILVSSFTIIFPWFFDFVESRNGKLLNDFLLDKIPSLDVSWIVFLFLYSGIIAGLYFHLTHPKTILIAFQTYVLITLVRMCTITLIPLEPPAGYLPLREPFVQLFTPGGKIISKDLFFSGHMSTILSLFFSSHRKYVRYYLFACVLAIAIMLLIQHVHYTVDVVVAIPATYLVFLISKNYLGGKTYRDAEENLS